MVELTAEGIWKGFGGGAGRVDVLASVSLVAAPGEWLTLLGPSGCGKTTLLRILAGVLAPDGGTVRLGGSAARIPGHVAYLPQQDTLLPWRTALGNALLPAEVDGRPRDEARDDARRLFASFGLSGAEALYPQQLSGGMRQRVEVARTFLSRRQVLLLDEPLGALDPLTRTSMQDWLRDVWAATRPTIVLVTHDVEEALLLSNRVLVLSSRPAVVAEEMVLGPHSRPRRRSDPQIVGERERVLGRLMGMAT